MANYFMLPGCTWQFQPSNPLCQTRSLVPWMDCNSEPEHSGPMVTSALNPMYGRESETRWSVMVLEGTKEHSRHGGLLNTACAHWCLDTHRTQPDPLWGVVRRGQGPFKPPPPPPAAPQMGMGSKLKTSAVLNHSCT